MTPGAAAAAGWGAASTTSRGGTAAPGRAADKDKQIRQLVAWHLNKQDTDEEEIGWPYFPCFLYSDLESKMSYHVSCWGKNEGKVRRSAVSHGHIVIAI